MTSSSPSTSTGTARMPPIEKTDYPSLSMGHEFSSTPVSIVGLELQVYGLEEIKQSTKPVVALIALHGRLGSRKDTGAFANGILGHVGTLWGEPSRDLIVITFDQRNHGSLLKDKTANLAFDRNPRHLYDMAATVVGGCQDTSLIIDFLAAYLFPHGERTIEEFAASGISLGGQLTDPPDCAVLELMEAGNVTWRLLQEEPRIRTAVPIIGLPFPSFEPYLHARAEGLGLEWAPPLFPPSIKALLTTPPAEGVFKGKRILTIHGGEDRLVPYPIGQDEIARIKQEVESSPEGKLVVQVMNGLGHVVTTDMVKMAAEWIWANCLTTTSAQ